MKELLASQGGLAAWNCYTRIVMKIHEYFSVLRSLNIALLCAYVMALSTLYPFFVHGATVPSGPGPPHYRGFTIALRHTTFSTTPLDESSARRKDLCLTTHSNRKRQASMPPARF
jgi:hypothetical protein